MAPRTAGSRRSHAPSDRIFELGVQGRKTGVVLRDTGIRDEHGMQPLEDIFSSPERTAPIRNNSTYNMGAVDGASSDSTGQDMDIENTTAPDPAILMRANSNPVRMPLPRSRSPIKTYLHSPARQNPHLAASSPPTRGSIVGPKEPTHSQPVKRRLDFSTKEKPHSSSQPAASSGRAVRDRAPDAPTRTSGTGSGLPPSDGEDADEETILHGEQLDGDDDEQEEEEEEEEEEEDLGEEGEEEEESIAMIDHGAEDIPEPEYGGYIDEGDGDVELGEGSASPVPAEEEGAGVDEAEEDEAEEEIVEEEPVKRKPGKPPKKQSVVRQNKIQQQRSSTKRKQHGLAEEEPEREEEVDQEQGQEQEQEEEQEDDNSEPEPGAEPEPEPKRRRVGAKSTGRKPAARTADVTPKTTRGKRGRPRRSSAGAADTSLAVVPRGPPLPKSRGLVSRRELPGENSIVRTRSGRNSYRPLAYWRNEHVDYQRDYAVEDAFAPGARPSKFLLQATKEVHRVDEPPPEPKHRAPGRRGASRGKQKQGAGGNSRRRRDEDDMFDEPAEPWEAQPGTVHGKAVVWQPEYEYAPPGLDEHVDSETEQLAVAGAAVQMREVRNCSFRYAKTLNLPFFAAGVVDLPPGSEKRPKNSRKMYMTFFVYAGAVLVTVNQTNFRISRGGMWFVPRGNIYSITNDYDEPARVFFSQGCEMMPEQFETDERFTPRS